MTLSKAPLCCDAPAMDALVTPEEATRRIMTGLPVMASELVPLAEAAGRILRRSIKADRPQPPYRRATMDGIAFRAAADVTSWRIAGLHAAGDPPPRAVGAGEAWEIMTGAQVPADCDCLVPYEEVSLAEGIATVRDEMEPGRFIHEAGSDAPEGEILVAEGAILGPLEIAIAASVGSSHLEVASSPAISILTTGDETVPVTDIPQPWQIRRSNGPMLESLLRSISFHKVDCVHVNDDPVALGEAFDHALAHSDVVLLCGGISKGKRDYVRDVIEQRLGVPAFHGVSQRPGKPLALWTGKTPVFALPGNPVSVLATFTRYVRPALSLLQGGTPEPALRLPLAKELEPLPKLTWHIPARIEGGLARCLLPQNSGDFISIAGATHLLEIPPGSDLLPLGHLVTARPL